MHIDNTYLTNRTLGQADQPAAAKSAAAGGQPVQRGGVDVGAQGQAVIGAGQAKWRSRISELSECLGRERWFFFDLAPLGGCHG